MAHVTDERGLRQWDFDPEDDAALETAAERSRAGHGQDSGLTPLGIALAVGAVLLLAIVAGLAIWAGASFSGGEPGVTSPAGG